MKPSAALELKRAPCAGQPAASYRESPHFWFGIAWLRNADASDLDLLVDALPGATLVDLGGLQGELEDLLGVNVDLRTPAGLPPNFRDQVLAEARPHRFDFTAPARTI